MSKNSGIKNIYPLSPMQEGMLFHSLVDSGSKAYFEQISFTIKGNLDIVLFEKSFNILVGRHDIFRTLFAHEKVKKPVQVVLEEHHIKIYYEDISATKEKSKFIDAFKIKDRDKTFNLSKDIPFRLSVIKLDTAVFKVVCSFHHILMDGWCIGIVIKELFEVYDALRNGKAPKLSQPFPYSSYIKWLEKQDKEAAKQYWETYLKDYEMQAVLPGMDACRKQESYMQRKYQFTISEALTKKLEHIAGKNQVTLNTVVQTAWGLLLQRYNNTDDVVFGMVFSGRPAEVPGIDHMIGLFINTLPVRVKAEKGQSWEELLQIQQKAILLSEKYSYYPLYQIQSSLPTGQSLINHILVFENYPMENYIQSTAEEDGGSLAAGDVEMFEQTNYDMNVIIIPGRELSVVFNYNASVFDSCYIKNMEQHFTNILKSAAKASEISIDKIDMMSDEEIKRICIDFNETKEAYPREKMIMEFFEEQAEATPDNIALVYLERSMTYRELDKKSNQLAGLLREKGVRENTIVGIMADRSFEMIIGIYGILKAGGAYVPIDPAYPTDRINYILGDSAAGILLIQEHLLAKAKTVHFQGTVINLGSPEAYAHEGTPTAQENNPERIIYVIYTSGSTGNPKGVVIQNRSAVNILTAMQRKYPLMERDSYLLKTAYTFDVSVTEIFGWFYAGGKLIIAEKEMEKDPAELINMIERHNITHINFVPSMLNSFINILSVQGIKMINKLKYIFVAGEALTRELAEALARVANQVGLANVYGPTEATIYASCYDIRETALLSGIPIGKPISNTRIYIVDYQNRLQPIGAQGELCIAGDGLAVGYLNMYSLTRERFISLPAACEERVYKTGDLARWRPDGNIDFLGRIDHQVKIRGFRIELGEIENQLLKHPAIKEAAVEVKGKAKGNKYICAYFCAEKELDVQTLRQYLSEKLPDYMLPAYFMQLERLPLTGRGKLDRKALPEPDTKIKTGTAYAAPQSSKEKMLSEAWLEVLDVEQIGVDDSFFVMGGDSIKAIQVMSKLSKQGYKIELREIFQHPTIRELSDCLRPMAAKASQDAITGEVKLTPVQKWFFSRKFTDKHHFNQATMLYRKEGFDAEKIRKVFQAITEHHDALRMIYRIEQGNVVQFNRNQEERGYDLIIRDFSKDSDYAGKIYKEAEQLQNSVDLSQGPLLKVGLFVTPEGDHLLMVIHHLVIDGISWRILLEDFTLAYSQLEKAEMVTLPPKTLSFKAWADKLYIYAESKALLARELAYWRIMESYSVPSIPKDKDSPERGKLKHSQTLQLCFTKQETEALLRNIHHAYHTEINDILLAALSLALYRWAGMDKILINLEGHGRESIIRDLDITRTVGWFTSMYPVLLRVENPENISMHIKQIKEILRQIPNKGIGYGILKYLKCQENENSLSFNLNPEISFNYLGQFDKDINTGLFSLSPLSCGHSVSLESERQFALEINGMVVEGGLSISFDYDIGQYRTDTIQRLSDCYKRSISDIKEHCIQSQSTELTPSDYGDNGLSIQELAIVKESLGEDIQKIYRLSPMQHNILLQSILSKAPCTYFVQQSLSVRGIIDIDMLEKSFNLLVEKYDIFRTSFVYEGITRQVQAVMGNREIKLGFEDISHLPVSEREKYIEALREKDKKRGFDLSRGSLTRLSVIQKDLEAYEIIWSFHHILIDGWCLGIIEKELFTNYHMLKARNMSVINNSQPYSNFIEWLKRQSEEEASDYWEKYLEGYGTSDAVRISASSQTAGYYIYNEVSFMLDKDTTSKLAEIAKNQEVTLNTVFQALWGLLMQRCYTLEDIVFGTVVSGRTAEIQRIENMVGLFINVIPVRVKCSKGMMFHELLKQMQQSALLSEQYSYLFDQESEVLGSRKGKVFDSVIFFENYPFNTKFNESKESDAPEILIEAVNTFEQTSYDLNVIVTPGEALDIRLTFNSIVYDKGFVEGIAEYFQILAERTVNDPLISIEVVKL